MNKNLLPQLMTTKQAAEYLGISIIRVRQLIYAEKIIAYKVGRDWVIPYSLAFEGIKTYGKSGRPKKEKSNQEP